MTGIFVNHADFPRGKTVKLQNFPDSYMDASMCARWFWCLACWGRVAVLYPAYDAG